MNGDYRTVVLPTIDIIEKYTFEHRRQLLPSGFASRGAFNWIFKYQHMPLLPATILHPSKPFETPIMAGGLFTISAAFFKELDGYDEGLNTYGKLDHISDFKSWFTEFFVKIGGEQFELSFKIWQCGGRMLESACSRFGHIYRYRPISVNLHIQYDFVSTVCICMFTICHTRWQDFPYSATRNSNQFSNIYANSRIISELPKFGWTNTKSTCIKDSH